MKRIIALLILIILTFSYSMALAVPGLISYQGRLTDNAGEPLNGNYLMRFELYNSSNVGSSLWNETQDVNVSSGMYDVHLGSSSPLPQNLFANNNVLYLQVSIRNTSGVYEVLSPRQRLTSAPYALQTANADTLGGITPGSFADASHLHDARYYTQTKVDTSLSGKSDIGHSHDSRYYTHTQVDNSLSSKSDITHNHDGRYLMAESDPQVGLNTLNYIPSWNGSALAKGSIFDNGNIGIGTAVPDNKLHVKGVSKFELGGGSISMSTPGGWPGVIMYSPSGHRRDVIVYDNALVLAVGSSPDPPSYNNGIQILETGRVRLKVLEITGGSDLSEQFEIREHSQDSPLKPGLVVSIDSQRPGKLMVSNKPYDRKVAGVISGAGGVSPGMMMGQKDSVADGVHPVSLTGRVYCWADASQGRIEPGDLLTTSGVPGHAMKVFDHSRAHGAVIGKAMTSLDKGTGLVFVLVNLQ